jgi:iron complex transport system substrate-binding protein
MKMMRTFLFSTLFLFLIEGQTACHSNKKTEFSKKKAVAENALFPKHAKGFLLENHTDYESVIVNNPWDTASILVKYYLVKDTSTIVPEDGIKIKIPIRSIAATSCTHFEFLNLLGEIESITAICYPDRVYNSIIRKRFSDGKITDLGDSFNMNLEKLFAVRPEVVMVSGFDQNDKYSRQIDKSGIPILYNQEWQENTLLGRAEWIKFVAAFYDKSELADSIFSDIENRYRSIANKATEQKEKPGILSGSDFRGTWYLPGGQSYMANMYKDAGADYFYSEDKSTGSLAFTFESVLNSFVAADYWFSVQCCTFRELEELEARYAYFSAFKKRQVYHFNKRRNDTGGSDFWESAIARPDLLLADVIKILHPELLPEHELFYTENLK